MSKITTGFKVVNRQNESVWFDARYKIGVKYIEDKWVWPQIKYSKLFAFKTLQDATLYVNISPKGRLTIYECDLLDECEQPDKMLMIDRSDILDILKFWTKGLDHEHWAPGWKGGVVARAIRLRKKVRR